MTTRRITTTIGWIALILLALTIVIAAGIAGGRAQAHRWDALHPTTATTAPAAAPAIAVATARCTEDQPCWNCHTMGNKTCGLVFSAAMNNCLRFSGEGRTECRRIARALLRQGVLHDTTPRGVKALPVDPILRTSPIPRAYAGTILHRISDRRAHAYRMPIPCELGQHSGTAILICNHKTWSSS